MMLLATLRGAISRHVYQMLAMFLRNPWREKVLRIFA